MTPEQEKLKIMMILKYGDLNRAFWSDGEFTPEENRILELNLEDTTDNYNVKRGNDGDLKSFGMAYDN